MFKIEARDDSDRWGPALTAATGTHLTPERASTFETAEAAFEKLRELSRRRPGARYRVVDAASGVVIWDDRGASDYAIQTQTAAQLMRPVAALLKKLAKEPGVTQVGHDTLIIDSISSRYRGMTAEQFAAAIAAEVDDGPPARSPELSELAANLVAAQEEFVAGFQLVFEARNRGIPADSPANADLQEGLYAAQEILTNLRELAKRLG